MQQLVAVTRVSTLGSCPLCFHLRNFEGVLEFAPGGVTKGSMREADQIVHELYLNIVLRVGLYIYRKLLMPFL